jgi:hypothetical protein
VSYVTNVILFASTCEEDGETGVYPAIDKLNAALREAGFQTFGLLSTEAEMEIDRANALRGKRRKPQTLHCA